MNEDILLKMIYFPQFLSLVVKGDFMADVENYRGCLKYILGGNALITKFNIDGKEHDTTKNVNEALGNLRSFIVNGNWTKNLYQKFVIMNICKSSEQIAKMYSAKSYKASSTRTLRTDGVKRLMKIIPMEYLYILYKADPYSNYDLIQQRKACKYFTYLAESNLSYDDLSRDYRNAIQLSAAQPKKCTLDECKNELKFLALNYVGYLNHIDSIDIEKLLYINSLLEQGISAEIEESDASILIGLSDTIKQLTDWFMK